MAVPGDFVSCIAPTYTSPFCNSDDFEGAPTCPTDAELNSCAETFGVRVTSALANCLRASSSTTSANIRSCLGQCYSDADCPTAAPHCTNGNCSKYSDLAELPSPDFGSVSAVGKARVVQQVDAGLQLQTYCVAGVSTATASTSPGYTDSQWPISPGARTTSQLPSASYCNPMCIAVRACGTSDVAPDLQACCSSNPASFCYNTVPRVGPQVCPGVG
jgi:hypothetical protein